MSAAMNGLTSGATKSRVISQAFFQLILIFISVSFLFESLAV